MIDQAMLMTAGLGTRLKPFTLNQTKALLPLMGIPMAQYALDALSQSGVRKVVANVHHNAPDTRQGLNGLEKNLIGMILSDESEQLLGSAGGIRKALAHFGDRPFFLANADVICDLDWIKLAARHQKLRSQWGVSITLGLFKASPPQAQYREIFFEDSGLVTGLGDLQFGRPYFMGAAVIEPEAIAQLPIDEPAEFAASVLRPLILKKQVGYFLADNPFYSWYDIGSPELWLSTHLAFLNRLESGDFKTHLSRLWQKRIGSVNIRLAEKIWQNAHSPRPKSRVHWQSPAYWGGKGTIPRLLGPRAVLYSETLTSSDQDFQNGIGFAGNWISG